MQQNILILKGDYRQRTRSYAFLITLAISLFIAYTFVPEPSASYTTVRLGDLVGEYTSAWIGYVTALMTSVFLSMIGFFLVNSSIKKDIDSEVGMIIATTGISSFHYLLLKAIGNFLVLLTIAGLSFIMAILLFFLRSSGYPFELQHFLLPYLFVTVPSLFLISSLAVFAEVLLVRRSVLMHIGFFILFNAALANIVTQHDSNAIKLIDPFGVKQITLGMQAFVAEHFGEQAKITSMGFNFSDHSNIRTFVFNGLTWDGAFILSRMIWIGLSIGLIFLSSVFFHRFDVKEKASSKEKKTKRLESSDTHALRDIKLSDLPSITPAFSILPFIKTEVLMLARKGSKWLWLINLGGMISLLFVSTSIGHTFVLPGLWFLQINRWSDLTTKEKTHRIHYFTYATYQPIKRLLTSQLIAGVIIAIVLAIPLIVRLSFLGNYLAIIHIVSGAIFVVSLASLLGIASGGKKLFEILFFILTYANANRIPFTDYFGAIHPGTGSILLVMLLSSMMVTLCCIIRGMEIRSA